MLIFYLRLYNPPNLVTLFPSSFPSHRQSGGGKEKDPTTHGGGGEEKKTISHGVKEGLEEPITCMWGGVDEKDPINFRERVIPLTNHSVVVRAVIS